MKLVRFKVVAGEDKGKEFTLEPGQCCALGREIKEQTDTKVLTVNANLSLDEASKGVVMNYVGQQFNRKPTGDSQGKEEVGGFQRLQDVHLNDKSISRLHSMVFCDAKVAGVLDLVSKNGTYVNGVEVESRDLNDDDLITVGSTKIRILVS
jgi:hypothetical protein